MTSLQYVDDNAVVRLPDGRVGFKGHYPRHPGKALVVVLGHHGSTGIEVPAATSVEVVKWPAELAREYLTREAS